MNKNKKRETSLPQLNLACVRGENKPHEDVMDMSDLIFGIVFVLRSQTRFLPLGRNVRQKKRLAVIRWKEKSLEGERDSNLFLGTIGRLHKNV